MPHQFASTAAHAYVDISVNRPWHQFSRGHRGTVVFTHGAGTDHRMFTDLADRLQGHGYGTLLWDAPAHASSPPAAPRFDVAHVADILSVLIEKVCPSSRVFLIGQSMGGNVAQFVVRRRPDLVRANVAIGCANNFLAIPLHQRAQVACAGPILRLIPSATLLRVMVNSSAVSAPARSYLMDVFTALGRRRFIDIFTGMSTAIRPDVRYVEPSPQLLLLGEKDRTGDIQASMRRWSDRDPEASLRVVAQAGHVAQLDQPELVAAAILDFLQEH